MFPKLFTQSVLFILIQWLLIKLVLANTGMTGLGYYFLYLSILAPVFMLIGSHFKNYGTQDQHVEGIGRIEWQGLLTLRDWQMAVLVGLSVAGALVLVGISTLSTAEHTQIANNNLFGRIDSIKIDVAVLVSIWGLVCLIKLLEMQLDTRQALEIRNQEVGFGLWVVVVLFVGAIGLYIYGLQNWLVVSSVIILFVVGAILVLRRSLKNTPPHSLSLADNSAAKSAAKSVRSEEPLNTSKSANLTDPKTQQLAIFFIKTVGLQAFIIAVIAAVPRVTVEALLGADALAVFGSLIYFYLLAHIITTALFQSRIALHSNTQSDTQTDTRSSGLVLPMVILLSIGLAAVGISTQIHHWLISIVFDSEVAKSSWRLPLFVGFITLGVLGTYLEQFYILKHRGKQLVQLNLIILALSVLACPTLVWLLGFDGVVIYMYGMFLLKLIWLWAGLQGQSISQLQRNTNG